MCPINYTPVLVKTAVHGYPPPKLVQFMPQFDLNAPAFGEGAQKADGLESPFAALPKTDEADPAVLPIVPVVEAEAETPVPYKRFKKFHDAAKEAQDEAAYWRNEAESLRQAQVAPSPAPLASDDIPREWVTLYGDSEQSQKAWQVQKQINADILRQAREEAIESVRSERLEEVVRTEQNLERLDDSFDELSDMVGRQLTDAEQSALLDIVDEYTPKDRNGNYSGDILPFDKAWNIYELTTQAGRAPKQQARNHIAGLSGNPTQGATQVSSEEQNKNWNPFAWDDYKKRL